MSVFVEMPDRVRELLARAGLGGLSDRAVVALAAVVIAIVAFAAWRFWPAPGGVEVATDSGWGSGEVVTESDASVVDSATPTAEVVVHVVGAVMSPGVYSLAAGSRVSDAVTAAGGATGNAAEEGLNLARVLADGEQIRVLTKDELEAGIQSDGTPVAGTGGATASGKININRATAAELDSLPGVGPSTAQKILADREANGPFKSIEDLMRVSGIGEKKFDSLKDLVTVG